MSDFKRERRYVVFKAKDLDVALSDLGDTFADEFRIICDKVEAVRQARGKKEFKAVVVEHDWRCYDTVWNLVEAEHIVNQQTDRSDQAESKHVVLKKISWSSDLRKVHCYFEDAEKVEHKYPLSKIQFDDFIDFGSKGIISYDDQAIIIPAGQQIDKTKSRIQPRRLVDIVLSESDGAKLIFEHSISPIEGHALKLENHQVFRDSSVRIGDIGIEVGGRVVMRGTYG